MPSKPHGDLIREQGEEIAKLIQRMDHFQQDLVRFETNLVEVRGIHQEDHTQLVMMVKDSERLEKRLDELQSRRWEIWKLIVAALVGAILSGGVGIVTKMIERRVQVEPTTQEKR